MIWIRNRHAERIIEDCLGFLERDPVFRLVTTSLRFVPFEYKAHSVVSPDSEGGSELHGFIEGIAPLYSRLGLLL